jgi:hypothetical protein
MLLALLGVVLHVSPLVAALAAHVQQAPPALVDGWAMETHTA